MYYIVLQYTVPGGIAPLAHEPEAPWIPQARTRGSMRLDFSVRNPGGEVPSDRMSPMARSLGRTVELETMLGHGSFTLRLGLRSSGGAHWEHLDKPILGSGTLGLGARWLVFHEPDHPAPGSPRTQEPRSRGPSLRQPSSYAPRCPPFPEPRSLYWKWPPDRSRFKERTI